MNAFEKTPVTRSRARTRSVSPLPRGEGASTSDHARRSQRCRHDRARTSSSSTPSSSACSPRCSAPGNSRPDRAAPLKLFLPAPELVWREIGVLVRPANYGRALRDAHLDRPGPRDRGGGRDRGRLRDRALANPGADVRAGAAGMFAVPLTMFFPLFVLLFGIGPDSKVAARATDVFFPIARTPSRRSPMSTSSICVAGGDARGRPPEASGWRARAASAIPSKPSRGR